jgi:CRISPR-associated endonuclease/helicase Cas3
MKILVFISIKVPKMFKNLAKPDETIIEHTKECLDVAKNLVSAFENEIELLLSTDRYSGEEIFLLSAIFHDLGKYATPFQEKTLGDREGFWRYRHEILSSEFVNLLEDIGQQERELIIYSILSHHNKTIKQLEKATFHENPQPLIIGMPLSVMDTMHSHRREAYEEGKTSILKYADDIFSELKVIISYSGVNPQINYCPEKVQNIFQEIEWYYKNIENPNTAHNYEKLIFLKGLLVTSDHLGSAHERILNIDTDIENYYKELFSIPINGKFRTTQKKCINSKGNSVILKAPTGTGKTEAAFLWVNENLKKNGYSRIFYILPYTASINAMFERLNSKGFAAQKVELLHGKNRAYYYDLLIKNKSDFEIEENIKAINKEIKFRKFSAKNFVKPVKIVTPHQIIKNFYGLKHFEEAFLQYRNGLFILDEIHCYDRLFLGELLAVMRFIKNRFNGSFLFMSATLPVIIEDIIKDQVGIVHETIKFGIDELHEFTRTRLNLIAGKIEDSENIVTIQKNIDNGYRVLIVCNTIKKAQQIYDKIECSNKILLHSAFNVVDRNEIENKIIKHENFKDKIQVLVGTQAIEVSLDLDYDCCYSEIASIDSLIQRFGRVFRNRKRQKGEYGDVYVFTEADRATSFIYNEEIEEQKFNFIDLTLQFLKRLNGKPLDYKSICSGVDEVYNIFYKNAILETFNSACNRMEKLVLKPMADYEEESKLYFEQFDGIKILPFLLSDQYCYYVESQRFIDADNLLVNLSERKLFNYYRKNYIYKMQVKGRNIFMADESVLGYSKQKGLYLKDSSDYNFI